MTGIAAYWWTDPVYPNVGDTLTPLVLPAVSGFPCRFSAAGPKWVGIGSILHTAGPGDVLCGTGSFDCIPFDRRTPVHALCVRGPRTRAMLGPCDPMLGDGGLAYPAVLKAALNPRYDIGVIPHYVDEPYMPELAPGMLHIPVSLPAPAFVARLVQCRKVVASALHGIVLAEAYGVPVTRMTLNRSDTRVGAFEYKHADYYEGTGRVLPRALAFADACREVQEPLRAGFVAEFIRNLRTVAAGFAHAHPEYISSVPG